MASASEITADEVRENKNGAWKKQAVMDKMREMDIAFNDKDRVADLRDQLAKALEATATPNG